MMMSKRILAPFSLPREAPSRGKPNGECGSHCVIADAEAGGRAELGGMTARPSSVWQATRTLRVEDTKAMTSTQPKVAVPPTEGGWHPPSTAVTGGDGPSVRQRKGPSRGARREPDRERPTAVVLMVHEEHARG